MASYTWLEDKYKLTPEEAAIVEWKYHYAGDFQQSLFNCIVHADTNNLQLLSLGFPVEVAGFKSYASAENWWPSVLEKLKGASNE